MKAVRFGSYSRRSTVAGTSHLRRLKSTMRYRRLAPPPRKRTAIRPPPPRPPDLVRPSTRDFSGLPLCSSDLSTRIRPRRPGVVGLNCFRAIDPALQSGRHVDRLALFEGHDRFFDVVALAEDAAETLGLALGHQGVDLGDLDVEQRFDGGGDFILGGVVGHLEHDHVLLGEHGRLLGAHRSQDGVVVTGGSGHYAASTSAKRAWMASTAARVRTSFWRRRTS